MVFLAESVSHCLTETFDKLHNISINIFQILLLATPEYNEDTVVTHQVLNEVIEYSFYPELQVCF